MHHALRPFLAHGGLFSMRTARLISGVKRTLFPQPKMSANDP
jgi:hypothetical protein